ncbi:MAG: hypothetical protein LBP20_06105 [Treponema sp.]|jgi:hypothetical protein|nr:hypothetical protein [Treponema sp.]
MNITIDGKQADIILEQEKTIGDVLSGLEDWLRGSGYRISGISVNGETVGEDSLDCFFNRNLSTVETLDLRTSSWAEHAVQSIASLYDVVQELENSAYAEREALRTRWIAMPGARFLKSEIPELWAMAEKTLAGEGAAPGELRGLLEERLRELENPRGELAGSGALIETLVQRLKDLPLDIQTGKDRRAAETMGIFSTLAEKLVRIFNLLKIEGLLPENITVEGAPVLDYIGEFDSILKDLVRAYEERDTVLVGDLSEYELAPRMLQFYTAIKV